jgi:subtilisin family serine protease
VTVRRHPNVASLKRSREYRRTLVRSVPAVRAAPEVLRRVAAPAGLNGSGVVVGVVDWGIDFGHANLRDARGRTRLLRLWDQRGGASPSSPAPFGYGRVFTREQIDAELAKGDPYAALGYDPQGVNGSEAGTHGTHVADIAVGTGRAPGAAPGVAPGADLVFVHLKTDDTRPEDTLGDSVRVLEAIRYVTDVADALRRPVVVNCSFGRTGGPKDASPLVTQGIDALLAERPGRQVVVSAGNYFETNMHAAGRVRAGETVQLPLALRAHRSTEAEIEVWYSGEDRFAAELRDPTGKLVASALPGKDATARDVAMFHRLRDPNNRDNVVNALIQPRAPGGTWTLRLRGESISDGAWHAWIERVGRSREQSRFPARFASPTSTIGTIAAGERAVSVAAVDVDQGRPARFSSAGPTRDARVKPDVAAPGRAIRAAKSSVGTGAGRSRDQLTTKSGTSMATPHVTGTIALMFQAAAPRLLAADETARILRRTALRNPLATRDELLRYGG